MELPAARMGLLSGERASGRTDTGLRCGESWRKNWRPGTGSHTDESGFWFYVRQQPSSAAVRGDLKARMPLRRRDRHRGLRVEPGHSVMETLGRQGNPRRSTQSGRKGSAGCPGG